MDILTIATREGDRAYDRAQGNEEKAAAYLQVVTETRKRGHRAEEIVEADGVNPNGGPGQFDVRSQSGSGVYHVNLEARECDCPDHQQRGTYCKHLQAAELYEDAHGLLIEPDGEQVVLEVEGYARGKQVLNKRLSRVRVNGGTYREARTEDFGRALAWLQSEGYELVEMTRPRQTMGTVTVTYIYRKPKGPENHDDALPVDRPRRRDRLFKTGGE
jgi:hypothetical protein